MTYKEMCLNRLEGAIWCLANGYDATYQVERALLHLKRIPDWDAPGQGEWQSEDSRRLGYSYGEMPDVHGVRLR